MAKRTSHQIAIDDALTKELCKENYIYDFMALCASQLRERFAGNPNVFFYVKGSAGLARYLQNRGIEAGRLQRLCARSDWDTQLVINPLLPAREWFATFKQAEAIIIESLKRFEDDLVPLFVAQLPPESNAHQVDLNNPAQRSQLAKTLRTGLAATFARVFLATSRGQHFDQIGHENHWNLLWDTINGLDTNAHRKEILDLDIQAHNQATLTSAMVHPGQALATFTSVADRTDLENLAAQTRQAGLEILREVSLASNEYDALRKRIIAGNQDVVEYLKGRLLRSLAEPSFVRNLPIEATQAAVGLMQPQDQQTLLATWGEVDKARKEREVCVQSFEADPHNAQKEMLADHAEEQVVKQELTFAWQVIECLKRNHDARSKFVEWCGATLFSDLDWLARYADECFQPDTGKQDAKAVAQLLTEHEKAQLGEAEDRIDAHFARYREEADPESMTEAQKRAMERYAPFALVEQQKGGRRMASILENMTIRDFYLYRLMVRCQINNRNEDQRLIPQAPQGTDFDTFKQQFKFRAELLDISVPRHDSLETAEQWARVRPHVHADGAGIPLPAGEYFLDEYILMFREVLDQKSASVHKFSKRLWRACLIAEAFAGELHDAGELEKRLKTVADIYPVLQELLARRNPGSIVLMRMCEQLIESHRLTVNDRLRTDTALMMAAKVKRLTQILDQELSDKTFLQLMKLFAQLGRTIYQHSFILAHERRKLVDDDQLVGRAMAIRDAVAAAFNHQGLPFKCAIVGDFAIKNVPDVPAQLKESLPQDAIQLVIYTNTAGGEVLRGLDKIVLPHVQPKDPSPHTPAMDVVIVDGTVYVRVMHPATNTSVITGPGKAAIIAIECVVDDNEGNWLAPRHQYDLKGILGHYRRTLPKYSEFFAQNQKKRIVQEIETILTTY